MIDIHSPDGDVVLTVDTDQIAVMERPRADGIIATFRFGKTLRMWVESSVSCAGSGEVLDRFYESLAHPTWHAMPPGSVVVTSYQWGQ